MSVLEEVHPVFLIYVKSDRDSADMISDVTRYQVRCLKKQPAIVKTSVLLMPMQLIVSTAIPVNCVSTAPNFGYFNLILQSFNVPQNLILKAIHRIYSNEFIIIGFK